MKVIAVNGSPRKGWNTSRLLQEALRGAEAAGAETELVHLYDLSFTGCRSCFACKRIGAQPCHCYWKDDLSPLLDRVLAADVLLLGFPVYFGEMSAQMHCFIERLDFILMTYDDYRAVPFQGRVDLGIFSTMNASLEWFEAEFRPRLEKKLATLGRRLNGRIDICPSCDTLQFSNYGAFHAAMFDEAHKKAVHETQFPKDLQMAFDLGHRLASR